jgi:hypothetical protein
LIDPNYKIDRWYNTTTVLVFGGMRKGISSRRQGRAPKVSLQLNGSESRQPGKSAQKEGRAAMLIKKMIRNFLGFCELIILFLPGSAFSIKPGWTHR